MTDDSRRDSSMQNPETVVAQEIFTRERGTHRDVPLADFLTGIDGEVRQQVLEERKQHPQQ